MGCSPWGGYESHTTERLHPHFHFHALEKAVAAHSSALAWRLQGRRSLGGCRRWGRAEADTAEATQQQQQHFHWCEVIPHCSFDLRVSNNERRSASFHVFICQLYVFAEISV